MTTTTNETMTPDRRRQYPPGVPCWVDVEVADTADAMRFYAGLFGWQFDDTTPPGAGGAYFVARKDGHDVAGIGLRTAGAGRAAAGQSTAGRAAARRSTSGRSTEAKPQWNMYVCVDDVDAALTRVRDAGGRITGEARELAGAARVASVTDPAGAALRLWEPRGHPGVQLANAPGTWNMNELSTGDIDGARAFYAAVFGWELDALEFGAETSWMARMPGYGEFLVRYDPELYERQADAGVPPGFADAVAWVSRPTGARLSEMPRWGQIFAVDDTDGRAQRATDLGGSIIVPPMDVSADVRLAVVADPAGAVFTISRYAPAF